MATDPNDLNPADIQNILNIMSRVDLKGNEAAAYVNCEVKLKIMMSKLGAPSAKVDEGDTTD